MTIANRAYVAGNFGLELDGVSAGWLSNVEGGMPTAEVIQERVGPDHHQHKHIGGVKYEDIQLGFGTGMSKEFWKWIDRSFALNYERKNGAILASDFNLKETSRINFYNALVSELGFPALDATAKDGARVTCKLTPEWTDVKVTPSGGPALKSTLDRKVQTKWHRSDFRLSVDGMSDSDCRAITTVDGITLKQQIQQLAVGELREYQVEPVQIEYPNLVLTVPESHSKSFWDWHRDFVIKGKNTPKDEKTGSLEYLTPNLKTTLFTLNFHGLGIFKITPEKGEAGSEKIRLVKVEMYCERIEFKYGQGATWD